MQEKSISACLYVVGDPHDADHIRTCILEFEKRKKIRSLYPVEHVHIFYYLFKFIVILDKLLEQWFCNLNNF